MWWAIARPGASTSPYARRDRPGQLGTAGCRGVGGRCGPGRLPLGRCRSPVRHRPRCWCDIRRLSARARSCPAPIRVVPATPAVTPAKARRGSRGAPSAGAVPPGSCTSRSPGSRSVAHAPPWRSPPPGRQVRQRGGTANASRPQRRHAASVPLGRVPAGSCTTPAWIGWRGPRFEARGGAVAQLVRARDS